MLFLVLAIVPIGVLAIDAGRACMASARRLSALELEAARYREITAQAPKLRGQIQAIGRELSAAQALYDDPTTEGSSARLGQTLKELIQAAGGEVRSVSMNPGVQVAGLDRLQISVDAVMPSAGLPRLLNFLQAQRPFLLITSLNLSAAPFSDTPGQIWLTTTVSAFHRADRAPI